MRHGILGVSLLLSILSCTPMVQQAVLPSKNVEVVKKGSFYVVLSEDEESFIGYEARRLGIPIPDREEIKRYLSYYLRNREFTERLLQRANHYLPIIRPVLEKYGLPAELAMLPAIESAFNPFAVSRSGAAGLWQFIPSTARRYGLRVDNLVDERFDILKSTEAAALYLRDLYSTFRNWELTLASYNCGENCVWRRTGGIDFWQTQVFLPEETKNYVPNFFALLLIARDPKRYGFNTDVKMEEVKVVRVNKDIQKDELLDSLKVKEDIFKDYNPHILGNTVPKDTYVYIPKKVVLIK